MRRIGLTIAAVTTAVAAALALIAAWLAMSLPDYRATHLVTGLNGETRIVRDARAVPHIFAPTIHDGMFALGFAHAQDRLWQMEWNRRAARGQLAAAVGREALPSDRLARLLRIGELADQSLPVLSGEVQDALRAYADGVNFWIAQAAALPPEFALLRIRPAPWRAGDSLALLRGMAAQMAQNVRQELLVARAAKVLPPRDVLKLFPQLGEEATLLGEYAGNAPLDRAHAALAPLAPASASNAWAIAVPGRRPVLANDPHLELGAPAIWYLARLETPGLSVAGATVPGVPFVLLGHNDRLAWGMTSSGADTQDLFLERVDALDRTRYAAPGGSLAFVTRDEVIEIAGEAPERLQLRETRHGPVLSDIGPRARTLANDNLAVALAYSGNVVADRTADALFAMNAARDWTAFVAASQLWAAPAQNVVVATRDGDIGRLLVGRLPDRRGRSGRLPRFGWSGDDDWAGSLPPDALPIVLNPAAGRIVDANNIPAEIDGRIVGDPIDADLRASRIAALLDSGARDAVAASAAIQTDGLATDAAALLPILRQTAPADRRSAAAIDLLRGWDLQMRADRPEPLILAAWQRELIRLLLQGRLGAAMPDAWNLSPATLARLLDDEDWCQAAGRMSCAATMTRALQQTLAELSSLYEDDMTRWRWGAAHRAGLAHMIWSRVPLMRRLSDLSAPQAGGAYTVGRAAPDFAAPAPFAASVGAAYRGVYDLSDLSRSRFVISTGQSGHPASPHYGDFTALWLKGESVGLSGSPEQLAGSSPATTVLLSR